MKEVSLVINPHICFIIFYDSFKIDELIEERGHRVLGMPPNGSHVGSIEVIRSRVKRYYNSIVGQNECRMEAVNKDV
jgi:hypothetical protein